MAAPDMSFFQGASNVTINGDVSSNNTSGNYINQSSQAVSNNYGSQDFSQTNYVNSNNDYSSHHHDISYGPRTTVNNVNSNNRTRTSHVNSNNDNSNTVYGGDWREYPQYPQRQGPPQGWPPRGQGQDYMDPYQGHTGMQAQYGPQAGGYPTGGQFDPSQNWGPDYAGNYQQQGYGSEPSDHRHRKERNHPPNDLEFEQHQRHSYTEAEFQHQQHFQHVPPRPASFHAAPAPDSTGYNINYTADFSQQRRFEQNSVPQAEYLTPNAQPDDWTEPSGSTPGKSSKPKKEKQRDNDRKGKKPQRATVETTDDEDYLRAQSNGERERKINDTLGPVLERLDESDDGFGDLLERPPPRTIPSASLPPVPVSSVLVESTSTATTTMGTQGIAGQRLRPTSTGAPTPPAVASTSQTASGRPAVAPTLPSSFRLQQPQASNSAPVLASTSTSALAAKRVSAPSGPTAEDSRLAQEAVSISRLSSTLSDGSEKKKKKKGVFSRINVFGKKKEKGGVVGLEDINIG